MSKSNRRHVNIRRQRKSTATKSKRKPSKAAPQKRKLPSRTKLKDKVLYEIEHYPQTEEFTSAAACAMMVLKHINPAFKMKKEEEYSIWQEAVNGSVWHGSKYGLAYSIAKRSKGSKVSIISNTSGEGYDRKLAVYENVNLDTLTSSYNETKKKAEDANVKEEIVNNISINTIKKELSSNRLPIVLIDANVLNSYLESSPHWIVVKGYDKDAFYINDPYSDSTITLDYDAFKQALGYDNNFHIILVNTRRNSPKKRA